MLTPRCLLGPIYPNKIKKKELTLYKRGQIVSVSLLGHKSSAVVATLKEPESTVRSTLLYDIQRKEGETIPRAGRLRK